MKKVIMNFSRGESGFATLEYAVSAGPVAAAAILVDDGDVEPLSRLTTATETK